MSFGLIQEIFYSIDMIVLFRKLPGMIDAMMESVDSQGAVN